MGKLHIEHPGGKLIYACFRCSTPLANKRMLKSPNFHGSTGKAYLFDSCVNIKQSGTQDKRMMSGIYTVRSIYCKVCEMELGWIYEFATEESQRYKEGNVILERSVIKELKGFDEDRPVFHLNVDLSQVSDKELEDYVVKNKRPKNNGLATSSSVTWTSDSRESPTSELCALPDSDEEIRSNSGTPTIQVSNSNRTTPSSGQLLPASSLTGSNRSTPLSHTNSIYTSQSSSGRSSARSTDLFAPIRSNTQGMYLTAMEPNLTPVTLSKQVALNIQTIDVLRNALYQIQNDPLKVQCKQEMNQMISQLLETNEKLKNNNNTIGGHSYHRDKFPSSVETVHLNLDRHLSNPDRIYEDIEGDSEDSSEDQSPDNQSQDDESTTYSANSSRRTSNNNTSRQRDIRRYNYSINAPMEPPVSISSSTQSRVSRFTATQRDPNIIFQTDLRQQGRLAGRLGTSPQPNLNIHSSLPSTSNISTSAIRTSSLPLESRYRSYLRSSNRAQQTASTTGPNFSPNLTLASLNQRQNRTLQGQNISRSTTNTSSSTAFPTAAPTVSRSSLSTSPNIQLLSTSNINPILEITPIEIPIPLLPTNISESGNVLPRSESSTNLTRLESLSPVNLAQILAAQSSRDTRNSQTRSSNTQPVQQARNTTASNDNNQDFQALITYVTNMNRENTSGRPSSGLSNTNVNLTQSESGRQQIANWAAGLSSEEAVILLQHMRDLGMISDERIREYQAHRDRR